MLGLALAAALLTPQESASIVINELTYEISGPDTEEFVELFNPTGGSVDLTGFVLVFSDAANANLATYTVATGTILPPGGFWVMGAPVVPNVNQVLTSVFGTGLELFPDWRTSNGAHTAVELRDAAGAVVDRIDYMTYGSGWRPAGMRGGGLPGATKSDSPHPTSLQRYYDGWDTGDNALDFRVLTATPGRSNHVQIALPFATSFESGSTAAGFGGTQSLLNLLDPTVAGPNNPRALPRSPDGGRIAVCYDQRGAGTSNMLEVQALSAFRLETWVFVEAAKAPLPGQIESWSIGVRGTTDGYHLHPDPSGLVGRWFKSGGTGVAWVYQRTDTTVDVWLLDFRHGGPAPRVLAREPIRPGFNDGWQRLALRVAEDRVEANFGGTYGNNDGRVVSARGIPGVLGGIYLGYREEMNNDPTKIRPLGIDAFRVEVARSAIAFHGQAASFAARPPSLDAGGLAFVGNRNFRAEARDMLPGPNNLVVIGFAMLPSPIGLAPLGGPPGSFLYVSPVISQQFVADPQGAFDVPLAVPLAPNLIGARLLCQAVTVATVGPALRLGNSRALEVTIGN
jgi:hypothetical protein